MLVKEVLPLFHPDCKVLVFDSHKDGRGAQKQIADGIPKDLMESFVADLEITLIDAGWQDEMCIDVIYTDRAILQTQYEIIKKSGIIK